MLAIAAGECDIGHRAAFGGDLAALARCNPVLPSVAALMAKAAPEKGKDSAALRRKYAP
jgi:hypothetical protein